MKNLFHGIEKEDGEARWKKSYTKLVRAKAYKIFKKPSKNLWNI